MRNNLDSWSESRAPVLESVPNSVGVVCSLHQRSFCRVKGRRHPVISSAAARLFRGVGGTVVSNDYTAPGGGASTTAGV